MSIEKSSHTHSSKAVTGADPHGKKVGKAPDESGGNGFSSLMNMLSAAEDVAVVSVVATPLTEGAPVGQTGPQSEAAVLVDSAGFLVVALPAVPLMPTVDPDTASASASASALSFASALPPIAIPVSLVSTVVLSVPAPATVLAKAVAATPPTLAALVEKPVTGLAQSLATSATEAPTPLAETPVTEIAKTVAAPVAETPAHTLAERPMTGLAQAFTAPVTETPARPSAETPVTGLAQTLAVPVTKTPARPLVEPPVTGPVQALATQVTETFALPLVETPVTGLAQTLAAPIAIAPSRLSTEKSVTGLAQALAAPVTESFAGPLAEMPMTGLAQAFTAPVTETPARPSAETPVTGLAQTLATPVIETPARLSTEKSATGLAQSLAAPVTETPARPLVEPPVTGLVQALATLVTETFARPFALPRGLSDNSPAGGQQAKAGDTSALQMATLRQVANAASGESNAMASSAPEVLQISPVSVLLAHRGAMQAHSLQVAQQDLKDTRAAIASQFTGVTADAFTTAFSGVAGDMVRPQGRFVTRQGMGQSVSSGFEGAFGQTMAGTQRSDAVFEVPPASAVVADTAVAETVSYWASQGVQTAELELEGFGDSPVEVSIVLNGDQAQIDFRTDQAGVRQVLEAATAQLKDLLSNQGLQLAGVSVGTSAKGSEQGGERRARQGAQQTTLVKTEAVGSASTRMANPAMGRSLDLFV